jgi:ubiquinone/menaquinone biosynthesis C-methylase UbiE
MKAYLDKQRQFWNVDPQTSKFGRVDTVSKSEAEYDRWADEHFARLCSGVSFTPDDAILEIGCGVGRLLQKMQMQPHRRLIGVDISANMIELTRQQLVADARTELYVNSGADLSMIASGSIDFCYSNDVFIHIADIDVVRGYFKEVARVLKPDALFRFNVRRLDLNSMFSNSPGGLLAKLLHLVSSRHLHRYAPGTEGFSGIMFRPREVRRIADSCGLSLLDAAATLDPSGGGFLWCDCGRPKGSMLHDNPERP